MSGSTEARISLGCVVGRGNYVCLVLFDHSVRLGGTGEREGPDHGRH